jgi:hypothetical protein|tara:strand:- start:243 stop:779 length:537 start_codon:yes stop_codon:yes gene_type:complete
MTDEEYYKAAHKWLQSNKTNKGKKSNLSPGTKKVDIQFFKNKKLSSYDKDQFKYFEAPDFIFSYIDHHEDYWFLNDNDSSYTDYLDDNCKTITIFDEDAELDIPEHRSFNFLEKCLKHEKINNKYANLISMAKNIEEIRWGNKVQYTEVLMSKEVDLTEFQNDLFESNLKVNFVLDTF